MQYEMLRNASVEARTVRSLSNTGKEIRRLGITIDGKYDHVFSPSCKESGMLEFSKPEFIASQMTGGNFFVVGGNLVDYRSPAYRGYVHDDRSIDQLVEHVGLGILKSLDRGRGHSGHGFADPGVHPVFARARYKGLSRGVLLGGAHSAMEMDFKGLGQGGRFDMNLLFSWNPFSEVVNSVVEVLRLICENGMVGISPLINTRIPLINKHKEHLDIAANQIQHRLSRMMQERLLEMRDARASLGDLMFIYDQAVKRLNSEQQSGEELATLGRIARVADPKLHCLSHYGEAVFQNSSKMKLLDGHLTELDAWNLLTEMDSHTKDVNRDDSPRLAHRSTIQAKANVLMFHSRNTRRGQRDVALSGIPLSKDSDHERAFFAASSAA